MHFTGETGSLKTESAKLLMSFYGDFANTPPLSNWRSTINSIELLGFWLHDMPGMVDDYKPRDVKLWDFTGLIQRYADESGRGRMSRDAKVVRKRAMHWWMLSTGEAVPSGEASVLSRMIMVRFPRRPEGSPYNAELRMARRLSKYLPGGHGAVVQVAGGQS
jgi:uncharacterized protein (DUF927 family)